MIACLFLSFVLFTAATVCLFVPHSFFAPLSCGPVPGVFAPQSGISRTRVRALAAHRPVIPPDQERSSCAAEFPRLPARGGVSALELRWGGGLSCSPLQAVDGGQRGDYETGGNWASVRPIWDMHLYSGPPGSIAGPGAGVQREGAGG